MNRIGHFAANLGAKGGISTYVHRLVAAQRQRGKEALLFSNTIDEELGVRVTSAKSLVEAAEEANLDVLHLHSNMPSAPQFKTTVVRTIHTNSAGCPSGSRYLQSTNKPCDRKFSILGCTWGHLVNHCGSRKPSRIKAGFENTRSEIAQSHNIMTIAVSEYVREEMVRSGCPPHNVFVLRSPSPVNNRPYTSPPADHVRIVFIGRIVSHKGLDWLIRSLASCPKDVILDVAGEGNPKYIDEIKKLAIELGVAKQVVWHGWINAEQVTELILNSRAVIFPSVWHEPAGLVTLEAAAYGRPVVASKVGAIPEYALPEFSRLVRPHDVAGLAHEITELARNHGYASKLGYHGFELSKGIFSMQAFVEKQDELYAHAREVRG